MDTLKEEIGNIVYKEVDGYDVTFGDTMTKLINLFKKKMLELVGEDDVLEDYPKLFNLTDSFRQAGVDLVNDTKQEIRDRIEESCK